MLHKRAGSRAAPPRNLLPLGRGEALRNTLLSPINDDHIKPEIPRTLPLSTIPTADIDDYSKTASARRDSSSDAIRSANS